MKETNLFLVCSIAALVMITGQENAVAQDAPNFDPQQMQEMIQQRMPQLQQQIPQLLERVQQQQLTSIRQQLGVTNDVEWQVLEPLLSKVVRDRTTSMVGGSSILGMFGGNRAGNVLNPGQSDPEREELQRLVDTGAAAKDIRSAMAKYKEACKRKADELANNREQLRKVLSSRQEAILLLAGILD